MPYRKFVFFNFMDEDGDIRAKEGNPDRKKNVSLDLSLSLGFTSSSAPPDEQKQAKKLECMEKNDGAFPPESKKDAGISLELSLSCGCISTYEEKQLIQCKESSDEYTTEKNGRAFPPESKKAGTDAGISLELSLSCGSISTDEEKQLIQYKESSDEYTMEKSNLHDRNNNVGLTLSLNPVFTSNKKRKREESQSPNLSNNRNKRRRLCEPEPELSFGQEHDPWCMKKKLRKSDILSDLSRLLLPKHFVESHVLPHWDVERKQQIRTDPGLQVSVFDFDTNSTSAMMFKRWKHGAYVFIQNWIPNFVMRRDLKVDDEIGLYWDIPNSRFNFSVLNRAPRV